MGFLGRLDPEVGAVLDAVPRLDLNDIPRAREERAILASQARGRWRPSGLVASEDGSVPGLPGEPDVAVRVHKPVVGGSDAVLLWVHGGGHVLGTASQDDPLMDEIVALTGCTAVAVDWRRAPEHAYPAALHDCYAALAWLARTSRRLVVGGASSGGGLAAGLALMARDRGEHEVAAQVLIYPMLDDRMSTTSSRLVTDPRVWNDASNRIAWKAYLGSIAPDSVPAYAAPAHATELGGLPWTWLATAELDLFCDEDIDYAQRLMSAGVSTELHVYRGAVHGFDLFAPEAAVTRRFLRDRNDGFRAALTGGRAFYDHNLLLD
jgi:acetyl esterase/lipase